MDRVGFSKLCVLVLAAVALRDTNAQVVGDCVTLISEASSCGTAIGDSVSLGGDSGTCTTVGSSTIVYDTPLVCIGGEVDTVSFILDITASTTDIVIVNSELVGVSFLFPDNAATDLTFKLTFNNTSISASSLPIPSQYESLNNIINYDIAESVLKASPLFVAIDSTATIIDSQIYAYADGYNLLNCSEAEIYTGPCDEGQHYCGSDDNNWTHFAPGGCVSVNWICDAEDDCVDGSDEALCDGCTADSGVESVITNEGTTTVEDTLIQGVEEYVMMRKFPTSSLPFCELCDSNEVSFPMGAVLIKTNGTMTIEASTIGHYRSEGELAGCFQVTGGEFDLISSTIAFCESDGDTGALYVNGANATLTSNHFYNNNHMDGRQHNFVTTGSPISPVILTTNKFNSWNGPSVCTVHGDDMPCSWYTYY